MFSSIFQVWFPLKRPASFIVWRTWSRVSRRSRSLWSHPPSRSWRKCSRSAATTDPGCPVRYSAGLDSGPHLSLPCLFKVSIWVRWRHFLPPCWDIKPKAKQKEIVDNNSPFRSSKYGVFCSCRKGSAPAVVQALHLTHSRDLCDKDFISSTKEPEQEHRRLPVSHEYDHVDVFDLFFGVFLLLGHEGAPGQQNPQQCFLQRRSVPPVLPFYVPDPSSHSPCSVPGLAWQTLPFLKSVRAFSVPGDHRGDVSPLAAGQHASHHSTCTGDLGEGRPGRQLETALFLSNHLPLFYIWHQSGLGGTLVWLYVKMFAVKITNLLGNFKHIYPQTIINKNSEFMEATDVWLLSCDHVQVLHVSGSTVLQEALPRCRVELLENCGHSVTLERPRKAADLITDFLSAQEASGGNAKKHSWRQALASPSMVDRHRSEEKTEIVIPNDNEDTYTNLNFNKRQKHTAAQRFRFRTAGCRFDLRYLSVKWTIG